MFHTYLTAKPTFPHEGGCRGGMFDENEEPVLEIGNDYHCSPEIMAFAAHICELKDLLGSTTYMEKTRNIIDSIDNEIARLTSQVERSRSDHQQAK